MSGQTPPQPPAATLPTPTDDTDDVDVDVMSNAEREARVRHRDVKSRQRASAAASGKHADEIAEHKEAEEHKQQQQAEEEEDDSIDYAVTLDDLDEEDKALLLSDDENEESITADLQRRAKLRQQKQSHKQPPAAAAHTAAISRSSAATSTAVAFSALSSAQMNDLAALEDKIRQLHAATHIPHYPYQLLLLWLNDFQLHAAALLALQKQHADDAGLSAALTQYVSTYLQQQYTLVYADLSTEQASLLSREERRSQSLTGSSLVYGEVSFEFMTWLWWQEPHVQQVLQQAATDKRSLTFVDLGAGTGKPSIATALLSNAQEIIGIELLNNLYSQAVVMVDKYQRLVQPSLLCDVDLESASDEVQQLISAKQAQQIDMHHGSIVELTELWLHADVILINSTCFDAKLMQAIAAQCAQLKEGTLIVTFTKSMTTPYLQLVTSHQFKQSWGSASIYIQQKVSATT